jgi:hypothetical protein
LSQFFEEETMFGAMIVLKMWIERYGVPESLYCDHKNAFVLTREASDAELLKGITKPLSHFGRACKKLGIEVIPANSPQAKGRVERNHGVDQDWLVKDLRLETPCLTSTNKFNRNVLSNLTFLLFSTIGHFYCSPTCRRKPIDKRFNMIYMVYSYFKEFIMENASVEQLKVWEDLNQRTFDEDAAYYSWIRNLDIDDKWKDFLNKIVTKTLEIGNKILNIGKILLNLFKEFVRNFPATTLGILLGLFFGAVISFIPFIGGVLAAIVTPLIVVALGLVGFTIDCYNLLTGQTIIRNAVYEKMGQEEGDKFRSLFKRLMAGVKF